MRNTLITLAKIHYEVGIIDYDEFNERIDVALWLSDEPEDSAIDPRVDSKEGSVPNKTEESDDYNSNESVVTTIIYSKNGLNDSDEGWLEFLCLGIWVFTKADPDSYPSIPHGHYRSQKTKWPKLNPYTGRVFKSRHQEDISES